MYVSRVGTRMCLKSTEAAVCCLPLVTPLASRPFYRWLRRIHRLLVRWEVGKLLEEGLVRRGRRISRRYVCWL